MASFSLLKVGADEPSGLVVTKPLVVLMNHAEGSIVHSSPRAEPISIHILRAAAPESGRPLHAFAR
jgi:hypothetical protein